MSIHADLQKHKREYIELLREMAKAVKDGNSQRVRSIDDQFHAMFITIRDEAREVSASILQGEVQR